MDVLGWQTKEFGSIYWVKRRNANYTAHPPHSSPSHTHPCHIEIPGVDCGTCFWPENGLRIHMLLNIQT